MNDLDEIKYFVVDGDFLTAGKLLDFELSKNKLNPYLWYLRGIVSLNVNNYPHSLECFENAIHLKRDYKYFKAKGLVYFSMFEFEESLIEFRKSMKLKKDSETSFYVALSLLFIGDVEGARESLETSYVLDKKKTKELLKSFNNFVLKNSWELSEEQKIKLGKLIDSVKD